MGNYERANEIAVLAGGRNANWTEQAAYGPPLDDGAGVALQGAIRAVVIVDLRDETWHRSAWVSVSTLDLTAVYTVTVDGNAAAYDAGAGAAADLQDVLEGIRDAINGTPAVAALVSAELIDTDDDTVDDTVEIRGVGPAHYTIAISATGTGVLACVADPDDADVRIYAAAGGQASTAPGGWRMINGAEWTGVTFRGLTERFDVASFARLAVEVDSLSGTGDGGTVTYRPGHVIVGPCLEIIP